MFGTSPASAPDVALMTRVRLACGGLLAKALYRNSRNQKYSSGETQLHYVIFLSVPPFSCPAFSRIDGLAVVGKFDVQSPANSPT